ncbi:hypothetical protein [Paenibacillus sp. LHD-38]|uniref:hypothetical protein n=1 Tax=Paenibacillus sp. LHD-38 TaxID=3072143 RepID=UPI00280F1A58|nr:hypothetical protein [Paenibacillus sp. LHD-38]MDQ8737737.1 hypothetical protein [Paenibacillus sp. LHD-38]
MDEVGRVFVKLVIFLFTLLFIIPAIIFSVLVIGLTDNLKSGVMMLISVVVLKIIVKFNGVNHSSEARSKSYHSRMWGRSIFDARLNQNNLKHSPPPPLIDIYREIDDRNGETEKIYRLIAQHESKHDYRDED